MRVPLSWLRELVSLVPPARDLSERLTLAGMEVDAIYTIGAFDPLIVVGAVTALAPLGPTLTALTVDVGARTLTVISGAPNAATLAVGARLAVALPGASVLSADEGPFEIRRVEPTVIRKVSSEGVACSARELGAGPDHSGLLLLPDDAAIGSPVLRHLRSAPDWEADEVLEIAILPNTARCMGMLGIAREVAALTRGTAKLDVALADLTVSPGALDATITATEECRRFSSARITGVAVRPSPRWMQRRLALCDVTPINNLVDVTNYCTFELGQPMHAYDRGLLRDERLGVRRSRDGESLLLLTQAADATPASLPVGTLVVTSGDEPVAVAGVVGGRASSVRDDTRELLMEAASFEWAPVRRAQASLKVHTDASGRFSRGVDPALTVKAIRRAVELLRETCPSIAVTATGDAGTREFPPREFTLRLDALAQTMGATYTLDEVVQSLSAVGIDAHPIEGGAAVRAVVTSARSDIAGVPDLLEEVARLVGYDRLPETLPVDPIPFHPADRAIEVRERVRDLLVRAGLQEVITYTLTDPNIERRLYASADVGVEAPRSVAVRNPVSAHHTAIRTTLLSGLLETLRVNARHTHSAHLFEIGTVVTARPGQSSLETQRVAFALMGSMTLPSVHDPSERAADLFDASQVLRSVLRSLHVEGVSLAPLEGVPFQPGLAAKVSAGGDELGVMGAVHPTVLDAYDLSGRRVLVCELALEAIAPKARDMFRASAPPRFPSIEVDISMFVAKAYLAARIESVIREAGGSSTRAVTVRDVFEGAQVPEGHRSIMVRVEFNAADRSLTMEEAQSLRGVITKSLREQVAADVRE